MTRVQTETGRSTKILLRCLRILKQVNKKQVQRLNNQPKLRMIQTVEYGLLSKRQANSVNVYTSELFASEKLALKSKKKCVTPQISVITLTISTGSKELAKIFAQFVRFCVSVEQNIRNNKQDSLKFMILTSRVNMNHPAVCLMLS